MLRSRDLFGAERRPELRMAAPWAGQSSDIARSRARAARRPCGEVVGHRPQAANYLDSREREGSDVTLCVFDRPLVSDSFEEGIENGAESPPECDTAVSNVTRRGSSSSRTVESRLIAERAVC